MYFICVVYWRRLRRWPMAHGRRRVGVFQPILLYCMVSVHGTLTASGISLAGPDHAVSGEPTGSDPPTVSALPARLPWSSCRLQSTDRSRARSWRRTSGQWPALALVWIQEHPSKLQSAAQVRQSPPPLSEGLQAEIRLAASLTTTPVRETGQDGMGVPRAMAVMEIRLGSVRRLRAGQGGKS
jgi:hypothetical protein